ncbi:PKD domain-containing protein [Bacteroidota bacterium]
MNKFIKLSLMIISLFIIFRCNKDIDDIETTACFSFHPDIIYVGDKITFSNCTENATSYNWSFGDNTYSSDFEPIHSYGISGNYTVTLTVENGSFNNTISKALTILDTCILDISEYDSSFGIDYNDPDKYLIPGNMSDLSDLYLNEIKNLIGTPEYSINGIKTVFNWFNSNFTFQNAGGAMIAQKTIDELYENKIFYGCHSASLILSSVLRELGFPAVMIETADIQWAYDYSAGLVDYFGGHVMSEIYVNESWILLDINGMFVESYNTLDPYIKMPDGSALFVYAKGIDIWDYGVLNEVDTHNFMIDFSENLICYESMFFSNNYQWKNL